MARIALVSGDKEMADCVRHSNLWGALNNKHMTAYGDLRCSLGRSNIAIKKRLMNTGQEHQTCSVMVGGGGGESVSRTKQPANCAEEYCDQCKMDDSFHGIYCIAERPRSGIPTCFWRRSCASRMCDKSAEGMGIS